MCLIDDGERCEVWREHKRKARKEHQCDCCRRTIKPGETYLVHFSLFEGDVTSDKCCEECDAERMEFGNAPGHMLFSPSYFPSVLSDCVSEGDDDDEGTRWRVMLDRIKAARLANKKAG